TSGMFDTHSPAWTERAMLAALPSPLKSPTLTSTQVTAAFQDAHKLVEAEDPEEMAAHHEPPCSQRPAMSNLPSPLKSPLLTSTQVTAGVQVAHKPLPKDEPFAEASHHWPAC